MRDTAEWSAPDSWLVVVDADGTPWNVDAAAESSVDAAVSRWIDSRETHDTLLLLTMVEGTPFKVKASEIGKWWVCSHAHRRRNLMREKWREDEDKDARAELGMPWEE